MSKKVGVAIVGTGFARKVQLPAFAACKDAELVSVASGSLENARSTAEEFGMRHFTDDWRTTVERDDVHLVCITTPPKLHREMTLLALSLGKHVLCEKPMAMNVAEAEEMTAAAAKVPLLALIDHELRFQPGRLKAFEMLREGAIGKVRHAKYNFRAPHRGDPNVPWNWWSDIEKGGGALGAINSHVIDSFQWLMGTTVSSVFCQLQTQIKQRRDAQGEMREVTTDDEANMLLRFADSDVAENATGLVSVSMTEGPDYTNRLELFGTDGAMRIDHRGEVFTAKSGLSEWTQVETDLGSAIEGIADTGFSRGFMQFAPKIVDAIRDGQTSIEHAATFADGLAVQKVLDAARQSNNVGQAVSLS
ncbi:MAG: Gfo/Idh/MocA family oxidoreductase [Acidobacteriota bacterium]